MAGLPTNFAVPNESSIATYSWTDIADSTGIVSLYGLRTINSSTTEYILSSSAMSSGIDASGGTAVLYASSGAGTTYTFNMSAFNTPRTVQGTAYASGYLNYGSATLSATVTFYKVSNGVETAISSTIQTISPNTTVPFLISIPLTQTNFRIGDTLRIKFVVAGHTSSYVPIYATANPLKFLVPFKINL